MKIKNIFRYIILPILIIIAALSWYVFSEYNRTHKNTASLRPDYSLNAIELVKDFTGNEQASNKKYWDKVIEVNGLIKEIKSDENGNYTIGLGDTTNMSSVRCLIDSLQSNAASSLETGSRVVIKGICTGFTADPLLGSDVFLVRCFIENPE